MTVAYKNKSGGFVHKYVSSESTLLFYNNRELMADVECSFLILLHRRQSVEYS